MKVCLDGAFGQDGKLLIQELIRTGQYTITALVHRRLTAEEELFCAEHSIQHRLWEDYSASTLSTLLSQLQPDKYFCLFAAHSSTVEMQQNPDQNEIYAKNYSRAAVLISTLAKVKPSCHFIYASSRLVFSNTRTGNHRLYATSTEAAELPYSRAKRDIGRLLDFYRGAQGFRSAICILFNHDSVYRAESYLIPTIAKYVAQVAKRRHGMPRLKIKNIGGEIDLSHARDLVRDMIDIAANGAQGRFVLASGVSTSIKQILTWAFETIGENWQDFIETEQDTAGSRSIGGMSYQGKAKHDTDPRHLVREITLFYLEQATVVKPNKSDQNQSNQT